LIYNYKNKIWWGGFKWSPEKSNMPKKGGWVVRVALTGGGFKWYTINLRLTLRFDQFLLSSNLSVHNWPIVANIFISPSDSSEGTFKSLRWTWDWPWTLIGHCGRPGGHCALNQKLEIVSAFSPVCREKCACSLFATFTAG
jgi:hypothetical protein